MKFRPSGDLVLVKLLSEEKKSESGLVLDMAKSLDADLPLYGEVIASGEYAPYDEGDLVLARRYTGVKVEVDGEEMFLFDSFAHILGVFSEDEE